MKKIILSLFAMFIMAGAMSQEAPYFMGIFQENEFITDNLEYNEALSFTIWNGFSNASEFEDPYAGDTSLYLIHSDGTWNAVGVTSQNTLDFGNYLNGYLRFMMKIDEAYQDTFRVGFKTQGGAEYATFFYGNGNDPLGFERNGEWQEVKIPILDMVERDGWVAGPGSPSQADLEDMRNPFIWNAQDVTVSLDEIWWAEGDAEPGSVNVNSSKPSTLSIYPNPASERIYLSGGLDIDYVEIFDMTGRVIIKYEKSGINSIGISDLKPGIYILKACGDNSDQIRKFYKK
jgi:hypothetical protein